MIFTCPFLEACTKTPINTYYTYIFNTLFCVSLKVNDCNNGFIYFKMCHIAVLMQYIDCLRSHLPL